MNIDDIIEEMRGRVLNDVPVSPASWIDSALRLNALATADIDKYIAGYEACMIEKEADLIESGESAAKAKILKTKAIDYESYLLMKAKAERVVEYIRLAKKRAIVPDI